MGLNVNLGCIPQRYLVIFLGFLGLAISYAMRYCMTLALVQMAQSPVTKEDPNSCPYTVEETQSNETKAVEYDWSSETQGLVQASFSAGYLVMMIPSGIIADKTGPKTIISLGVALTALFTLITPSAIRWGDWPALIVVRVCVGVAQGMVYPPLHTLVANWAPKEEMANLGALLFAGSQAGSALNNVFAGVLLGNLDMGWPSVFYFFGSLGALWTALFYLTTYDRPEEHPNLSLTEKELFKRSMVDGKDVKKRVPWKELLLSGPVWAILIANIGHDWGFFATINNVPMFMKSVLHLDIKKNSYLNASIYFFIWIVCILSGLLVSYVEKKKWVSTLNSRKIGTTLSHMGPAVGLVASVYTDCNKDLAIAFLVVGLGLLGFYYSSLKINSIDVAPNFAGTIGGLNSLVTAAVGFLVPYVIGLMTPNGHLNEWRNVMWTAFGILAVTNAYYLFTASAEAQPWNNSTQEETQTEERKKDDVVVVDVSRM